MVMMCVKKSANYEIIINGSSTSQITPSRGVRQGDSISPYLFLICAKVLSSLLAWADNNGDIAGVPTSKKGPKLNQLFFLWTIAFYLAKLPFFIGISYQKLYMNMK